MNEKIIYTSIDKPEEVLKAIIRKVSAIPGNTEEIVITCTPDKLQEFCSWFSQFVWEEVDMSSTDFDDTLELFLRSRTGE